MYQRSKQVYGYVFLALIGVFGIYLESPLLTMASTIAAIFLISLAFLDFAASFTFSVIFPLSIVGFVENFSKFSSIPLMLQIQLVFLAITLICAFISHYFKINKTNLRINSHSVSLAIALLAPASITLLMLLINGNILGLNLAWVVNGDAQTNTVSALEILEKNGFVESIPSLTQGIMAFGMGPLIPEETSGSLFIAAMQTQAGILSILWALVSVLMGLIALAEFSETPRKLRILLIVVFALLPLSWGVLGFSLEAGFFNTPMALMSVLATWIFWRSLRVQSRNKNKAIYVFLIIATFFAVLAWPPLAILPCSLLIFITAKIAIGIAGQSTLHMTVMLLSVLFFAVLIGFWVAPKLTELGKIAAADGYMAELSPKLLTLTVIAIFLSSLIAGKLKFELGNYELGLILLTTATLLGLVVLVFQGFHPVAPLNWYYYPRKLAWISIFVLNTLTIILLITRIYTSRNTKPIPLISNLVLLVAIVILFALEFRAPATTKTNPFPLTTVALESNSSPEIIKEISAAIGTKQIRLEYDNHDFIVNQWAFQWNKYDANKKVWSFAYSQISNPHDVCMAANAWGGQVTLLTTSPQIETQVLSLCGKSIAEVRN